MAYHLYASEPMAKQGVLDDVFSQLQANDIINIQVEHVSVDSTAVKLHPGGTGAL